MSYLPVTPPKEEYCKRHGITFNPYGVCPECARENDIKAKEREEKRKRLKQVFENTIWPDSTKRE
jgi:hypothetical protein